MAPRFLTRDAVLGIHFEQIDTFGGSQGVRDEGLLDSALGAAEQTFAYTGDLHQAAAQYLLSLARNHPFVDGNKRTATACALVFLDLNEQLFSLPPDALFELVLETATGMLDREAIADKLRG